MYDELYDAPVNYQFAVDPSVWDLLVDLNPRKGAFGRYLESLKRIRDAVDPDTPVVATVFAPFHIAVRLAWKRLIHDCRTDRDRTRRGLAAIARNQAAFVAAARDEAGIDAFFLGCFGCEPSWLTREEYRDIAAPYDEEVLAAMRPSPVIVHSHGEDGSYFDIISSYGCEAISWEDRQGGPSLSEARLKTAKCLVGGVDHVSAVAASPDAVRAEALDAIARTGGKGLILAPGCTFLEGTPAANMLALKEASVQGSSM
jgi:uroporphyrinogen decarboxylase